jgi:hypothetical protein
MIPAGLIPLLPLGIAGAWLTWRSIHRRITVRREVKRAREEMARFNEEAQQWLNGKS